MASCCDNVSGAKSPQKQNSLWCRFPWKAMAGQLCGRWGRPQLYQKVGKGRCNSGLYWEIKKAVIVSWTGKSGLLKASRMGRVKDVSSLCCWVCAGVCWWCREVQSDCFATCASRSWGTKDSVAVLSVATSYLEHFIWFIWKYFKMYHHREKEKERLDSRRRKGYTQKYIIIQWY